MGFAHDFILNSRFLYNSELRRDVSCFLSFAGVNLSSAGIHFTFSELRRAGGVLSSAVSGFIEPTFVYQKREFTPTSFKGQFGLHPLHPVALCTRATGGTLRSFSFSEVVSDRFPGARIPGAAVAGRRLFSGFSANTQ